MVGSSSLILLAAFAIVLPHGSASARSRIPFKAIPQTPIVASGPTLAPFQHVRFCLHYPDECRSNSAENERIDLTAASLRLLERVNHRVNVSIVSKSKSYGSNLEDTWTIAPDQGDCNDYAVTKRHELLKSGLPSSALRLGNKDGSWGRSSCPCRRDDAGDLVTDSLRDAIQPWQTTDYQWLKIQSAHNPNYWVEVGSPIAVPSSF